MYYVGRWGLDTVVEQDHTHGKCHCATVWTSAYVGESEGHLASSERLPRARPAATWSTISGDATRLYARALGVCCAKPTLDFRQH